MKQIEYSIEQRLVMKVLEPFKHFAQQERYAVNVATLRETIKKIEEEFNIKPQYKTLREYLNAKSRGAYHRFYFNVETATYDIEVKDITSVDEFERYFNPKILDEYFVINDDSKDNGGNCENYQSNHYLTLERID